MSKKTYSEEFECSRRQLEDSRRQLEDSTRPYSELRNGWHVGFEASEADTLGRDGDKRFLLLEGKSKNNHGVTDSGRPGQARVEPEHSEIPHE
jgi:hypothetical protein